MCGLLSTLGITHRTLGLAVASDVCGEWHPPLLSYRMILVECARYREVESKAAQAGGLAAAGQLAAADESLMDPGTEAKLVAYLNLFA